ncbi:MAG: CDP-diacylglycerol--glycerol-3-phosphate 3-phosphatidyltransferase [Gammaproteobacteria bacterium]|nr:CDP-diacylglycerol--glycerol-3-phosphate 3-phosphatidyltransferase [Gammaproteobacteria bacterium]MCY4219236.1 CDP-diacylglycerol--glycerol-3-phosphate 3-phosphatidyltransferase [Gammaproteobacteria bacterium]MCY4273931.1 CDP-diacylglycerol--glycerol-3-phosphate 3-phosphatidyltransferase [Gammaproteobacteria bacterium]
MLNLPNVLTLFRIGLVPILVIVYFVESSYRELLLAGIFLLAAITDWLDGFLARKLGAVSDLGSFLDPVADKLIVACVLVLLASDPQILDQVIHPAVFSVAVCVIIGREITISALREWMSELGSRGVVSVSMLGKIKTVFQMTSIVLLLYAEPVQGIPIFRIGEIVFYITAILTLWSMWVYLKSAMPILIRGSMVGKASRKSIENGEKAEK